MAQVRTFGNPVGKSDHCMNVDESRNRNFIRFPFISLFLSLFFSSFSHVLRIPHAIQSISNFNVALIKCYGHAFVRCASIEISSMQIRMMKNDENIKLQQFICVTPTLPNQ